MASIRLKKHPLTRAAHYLYLLPFLPALQPLLVNYRTADMIIYLSGILLVLSLVIYSNHRPLIKSGSGGLSLYLHYRHNAEYHPFGDMTGYQRLSGNRISLFSKSHKPVVLNLKKDDVDKLISRLNDEKIKASAG